MKHDEFEVLKLVNEYDRYLLDCDVLDNTDLYASSLGKLFEILITFVRNIDVTNFNDCFLGTNTIMKFIETVISYYMLYVEVSYMKIF